MKSTNNQITISELQNGDLFQIVGHPVKRTYVYEQPVRTNTAIFKSADGNGEIKLHTNMMFKIFVIKIN